jgi:membrane associated rhomboid family serine protease
VIAFIVFCRRMEIWVKLEHNRNPFKVTFRGNDVYDLKKAIKEELAPKLDSLAASDLAICAPADLGKAQFQENLLVAELVNSFGSGFRVPWVVELPVQNTFPSCNFELPTFHLSPTPFPWLYNTMKKFLRTLSPHNILFDASNSITPFTLLFIIMALNDMVLVPFYSVTSTLLALHIVGYLYLKGDPDVEGRHFASSADNLKQGRYWTLLTSSFAHANFNHLLCNMISLSINSPQIERKLGFLGSLFFFTLSSIASSLVSIYVNGGPSIGSSGVLYAMDGYLLRWDGEDINSYAVDQIVFHLATGDSNLDHYAHVGGFVFGLLYAKLRITLI